MFSPIQILHQIPFLRLILFLIIGILLASLNLGASVGIIGICLSLIIGLTCTFIPPNLSYLKGLTIAISCITLGYFSATTFNPLKHYKTPIEFYAEKTKDKISDLLSNELTPNASSISKALLIADKSELSRSTKKDFSRAGASHILAVSGMHVGIIFTAISSLLSIFFKQRNYKLICNLISLIFLWFYAFICGLQPSIVRACTMFTIPIIGQILHRDYISFNSLLFTAFCMLIYDYTYLFNIGFQLSFLAVSGILLFQKQIFNIFRLQNKILIWLWNLTSVSIAAQITTLPLTIFYFHELPILSIISNLVVIPLATLLIYSSGLYIFLSISPSDNFMSIVINTLSYWFTSSVKEISKISYSVIENIDISILQVIILYLIIFFIKLYLSTKKSSHLMYILSLIIIFLASDMINLLFL